MEKELSSILLRQLKRCKIELDGSPIPAEVFREFLGRVDTSYDDLKEHESRYEKVCRQSSDEIATYISKLKQAEALNRQQLDILNMLRYIRQGIFTITDGRRIHPEYSVYTTELLERSDLAGCDVKEVLLQKAAIGADSLEQILSVLDFSFGAEEVSFSANQHILPRQLILNFPHSREKTVEIDWTPILNDAGVVEKILVSLGEVSELKMLEKVNLNQQRELEILSQLLSTSSDRFQQFHRNSVTALEHCRSLLEQEGHRISMAAKAFGYNEKPEQMQRHHFVETTLDLLRSYQDGAVPAEQALAEIATNIRVFEYSPLNLILKSVVSGSALLAQELGKLLPQINVPHNALGFHRKTHAALESILII
jgi:two-component system chemotaxis sensor kinase CheA